MLKSVRYILLGIILLLHPDLYAQTNSYRVAVAPFSTLANDEFSPVYYKNGIVFCSNMKNNSLINYKNGQKNLFNIFFAEGKDSGDWANAKLLAKELTTNYNDGPATFSITGDTVYFCRNNDIKEELKPVSDSTNKLGIYSAVFINGIWTNIRQFTYDNPLYSFVTPALSPDGKRLYFASDMPGGYGGTDIYYCDRKGSDWEKPVNLGPAINTPENESYPFVNKSGKLFFASDRHGGFGGKDLYYSQEINGRWITPIHLDADINSPFDDFGLVTDANFETGYFSSNRRKTDDIYSFATNPVQFPVCDSMMKNDYCFIFYDEFQSQNDTAPVIYQWDFGNGIKKYGEQVNYCFPGPGNYEVRLNLLDDQKTDSIVSQTSYKFGIEDSDQAFINSREEAIVNEPVSFDGFKSVVPGFKIADYLWDFGSGFTIKGPVANKTFSEEGEYTVKLGLLSEKDSTGKRSNVCVSKKIKIFNDYQELAMQKGEDIGELGKSYFIKRPGDSVESASMEAPEVLNGPGSLRIKIYLLKNLSELQKKKIVEHLYETRERTVDMNDEGIDTESYPVLEKFMDVLKENPGLKLVIAVHADDQKFLGSNQKVSENWAHDLYTWFLDKGISSEALYFKGYGDSRPALADIKTDNRDINRRVEFIFMRRDE